MGYFGVIRLDENHDLEKIITDNYDEAIFWWKESIGDWKYFDNKIDCEKWLARDNSEIMIKLNQNANMYNYKKMKNKEISWIEYIKHSGILE